ncbi:MDR family MFS transporter [Priestia flexa]|uniref:Multidrug efflux MFS transporter n=1 Tax=Priestia flexa TaxID=86664 RepID=A0A8I1MDX9_9BACI|nr:MDR family MFS transporter [Priestia flexa]MBN8251051.1 multidrug efflux MFS transporter [Priestia flexa]MBN8433268.1 multidrug efflux MFS transporter [Priestia flexa]MCA0965794.1 multidrug efflux MFS transporter [Priestia flexa]
MKLYSNQKLVVMIVYVMAMFMAAMDGTIVNVALPTISQEFQISPAATGSINVGYLVSLAVFLPISGWLGDRFGTKKVFLVALAIFTVSSALCGLATHLFSLNLFRICQGAAGGLLTPVGMAMLYRTFLPEERSKVARTLVLPIAVAPAIGPVIGGLLVEAMSWPWVFYINIPFGFFAFFFGLKFLNEHKENEAGSFDFRGFMLSAVGLASLMYALNHGPSVGWLSPLILSIGGLGLLFVSIFIVVQLRTKNPMLNFHLLSDRLFQTMSIISALCVAGLLGILYVFPLMYQNAFGASALESGLTTFPEAIGLIIASRIMPWSTKKIGVHGVIRMGLVGSALMLICLSLISTEASPWIFRMILFSVGLFLGHTVVSVQAISFNNISPSLMGRATTLFNVQNRLGSAVGIAILSSIIGMKQTAFDGDYSSVIPYQIALLVASLFLLLALILTFRIHTANFEMPKTKRFTRSDSSMNEDVKVSK